MKQAVIVSTARTGLAKSVRGGFNDTHGAVMGGHAVRYYGLDRNTNDFDLHLAPDCWDNLAFQLSQTPLFAGKPVIQSGTKRAVAEPETMVQEALQQQSFMAISLPEPRAGYQHRR